MDASPTRSLAAALVLLAPLLAVGCAAPDNDRLTLGTSEGPRVVLPGVTPGGVALTDAQGPSVVSLDRSHWGTIDFLVPNDATEHHPTFTRPSGMAGAFEEYPTVETAFDQEREFGSVLVDAIAWPLHVARDAVMIIPRAIDPERRSPVTRYERAPAPVRGGGAAGR